MSPITDTLIVAIITFIAVSDVLLIRWKLPSYSRRFRDIGARVSFLPYAWGVLAGHWWAPVPALIPQQQWGVLIALLVAGALVTAVHWGMRRTKVPWLGWLPLPVYLSCGVVAGVAFWSLPPAGGWLALVGI